MQLLEAYTMAEAGRTLGVSRQRIHQLIDEGRLGIIYRGARRYVSGITLQRELAARQAEADGQLVAEDLVV